MPNKKRKLWDAWEGSFTALSSEPGPARYTERKRLKEEVSCHRLQARFHHQVGYKVGEHTTSEDVAQLTGEIIAAEA